MRPEQFEVALQDLTHHFPTPAAIAAANDLSREQKVALLRQWEQDEQLLMVATEENMSAASVENGGERLRQIHRILAELGFELDPEREPAHKSGAAPLRPRSRTKR